MKLEKLLAAFQATVYFPEILKVKKSFETGKIDFLFLKGLPLHLYFENSPPRRVAADCDILVEKNSEPKVKKIFNRLGYQLAETSYSKFHRRLKDKLTEVTYFKVIKNCLVAFDVHFEVVFLMNQLGRLDALYPQKLVDEISRQFLAEKQQVKIRGQNFPILSPANLIIYLGLHFFHHNFKGLHRLKFLNKIVSYYRRELANGLSGEIVDKVKHYQLQNFIYPGLVMASAGFRQVLPEPDRPARKYIEGLIRRRKMIDADDPLTAGINRFKNIFYLSPRPWYRKILIFFNPAVIYSAIWTLVWAKNRRQFTKTILRLMKTNFNLYFILVKSSR